MKEAGLDPSKLMPSGGAHGAFDLVGEEGEDAVGDRCCEADERNVAGEAAGDDLHAGVEQQGEPDAGPSDCSDAESFERVAGGCDTDDNQ